MARCLVTRSLAGPVRLGRPILVIELSQLSNYAWPCMGAFTDCLLDNFLKY